MVPFVIEDSFIDNFTITSSSFSHILYLSVRIIFVKKVNYIPLILIILKTYLMNPKGTVMFSLSIWSGSIIGIPKASEPCLMRCLTNLSSWRIRALIVWFIIQVLSGASRITSSSTSDNNNNVSFILFLNNKYLQTFLFIKNMNRIISLDAAKIVFRGNSSTNSINELKIYDYRYLHLNQNDLLLFRSFSELCFYIISI